MTFPGLGELTKYDNLGWLRSEPVPVRMFGGKRCRFVFDDYVGDDRPRDYHAAVANFLASDPAVLLAASEALFLYYKDFEEFWLEEGNEPIRTAADTWKYVRFGSEPMVTRRNSGDKGIYISIESECAWEPEHGLEIVLKNGTAMNKLGPHDGHVTNANAYDNPLLEHVIYVNSAILANLTKSGEQRPRSRWWSRFHLGRLFR